MKYFRYIIIVAILAAGIAQVHAQQEEVKVVKPYTPTLSAAEKIQVLPGIGDSVEYEQPVFEYSIFPRRYETDYRVIPIEPARMVKPALDKLYKSEIKMGMGNYLSPLAELRINQVRSSKSAFGVNLEHHSMNGQVRLDNKEKVPAGFAENKLDFNGKRFYNTSILNYNVGAAYNSYVHYGVDTIYSDSVSRETMNHMFFNGHAGIGFQSARPDSMKLQYKAGLQYDFFTHAFEQMEHGIVFDGTLETDVSGFRVGGDAGLSYFGHQASWDTALTNQFIIKLNPYLSKYSSEWMFLAGINTYSAITNGEFEPHAYIHGKFSFNIVKEVLVPYFGVDGYLEDNSYMKISMENPYIVPGTVVRPTNHKMIVYVGLKGKITDYLAWNIKGKYESVGDQYFFVTDTSGYFNNQFTVRYDDISILNVSGELNIAPTEALRVMLKGNYYDYELSRETYAWYKPDFDASLQARYNLGDKILADAGLLVVGPRYYPSLTVDGDPGKLGPTIDLSMGVEYRYTKLLSFWAKFNNITAQPYYMYYNYPSHRFRLMLGFTYGL